MALNYIEGGKTQQCLDNYVKNFEDSELTTHYKALISLGYRVSQLDISQREKATKG